jgi:hypothetical protein
MVGSVGKIDLGVFGRHAFFGFPVNFGAPWRLICRLRTAHAVSGWKNFSRSRLASLGARALCHTRMPYMIWPHWRIGLYANYKYLRASCDMPASHYARGDRMTKIFRARASLRSELAHCSTHAVFDFFLTHVQEDVLTNELSFTAFACSATCRLCSARADRTEK